MTNALASNEIADLLERTAVWAEQIRQHLGEVLRQHGDRVHFRPCSGGVTMVGLHPDRPQRGRGGLRQLAGVAADFERLYAQSCVDVEQGRATPEKQLQSFLLRSQDSEKRLVPLNLAAGTTPDPAELLFITDELALPAAGKIVCDVLALRVDGGRSRPVAIELKTERELTRLVHQVRSYAALVDENAAAFARLFGAVLGRSVSFDGPCERWIAWPMAGESQDPREEQLCGEGVRIVGYRVVHGGFELRVGKDPSKHRIAAAST